MEVELVKGQTIYFVVYRGPDPGEAQSRYDYLKRIRDRAGTISITRHDLCVTVKEVQITANTDRVLLGEPAMYTVLVEGIL
jgi:hypothetical protein